MFCEHKDKQLVAGVVIPAEPKWASTILHALEKNETLQFRVDYWSLNAAAIPDTYPLPHIDECIDSSGEALVITELEAPWGYWQRPIKVKDRDKNTFTSLLCTNRYTRISFGLRNALATIQRALNIILSGVRWKTCLVCIIGVVMFSRKTRQNV